MFDSDMHINGKYATYWKALSRVPGNAVDNAKNFKIFERYIYVYMVAPIIGMLYGKKVEYNPLDGVKDSAGMLAEVQIKNQAKLKYIYRLIVLSDTSLGLSDAEKVNMAFRKDNDAQAVQKGMKLYTEYFLGGLDVLYHEFVENCSTDDDYIQKMFEFISDFKEEQSIDNLTVEIESLLGK